MTSGKLPRLCTSSFCLFLVLFGLNIGTSKTLGAGTTESTGAKVDCGNFFPRKNLNPKKGIVVVVDKKDFCTFVLQLNRNGGVSAVFTTPNSIGRIGHETPSGRYRIVRLVILPIWEDPVTKYTINSFDRDSRNPLGIGAITLAHDRKNYLPGPEVSMVLHGTNHEELMQRRISASCIRHPNAAIRKIISMSSTGGLVIIVDDIDNLILMRSDFR